MKAIRLLYLAVLVFSNCKAQDFTVFYGKWKVKDEISFVNMGYETKDEYNDRLRSRERCLKTKFIIDSSGIHCPQQSCGFLGCERKYVKSNPRFATVIKDNQYTLDVMGNSVVDSNVIGEKFAKMIKPKYSKKTMTFYDTGCLVDYGSSILKIFIASKNRIALFQDYNLIVLERDCD
jgi:hypothetical protein